MKIIGTDNLARESVADILLIGWIPSHGKDAAETACNFLNSFSCDDNGGTFYKVVEDDYRLSKGMADLV